MARYLAWFPFPHYAVAAHNQGVWNFSDVLPMFERFHAAATAAAPKSYVANFATQPAWAFSPELVAPRDPDEPAWTYANGQPVVMQFQALGTYYAILYHFLRFGWALDEAGRNMTGGTAHDIPHWEVFNENEHEFSTEHYASLYDSITSLIARAATERNVSRPKFVALGGCSAARLAPFLAAAKQPVDYVSLHFRCTCGGRNSPTTYEELFYSAQWFAEAVAATVIPALRNSTQKPGLLVNEAETILPMDYDTTQRAPSPVYWAASAGAFASLFV
jgi:hypothetical protein